MAQVFIISGDHVTLNDKRIFYAPLGNSLAVSSDTQTVYVANPHNINKYTKTSVDWTTDSHSIFHKNMVDLIHKTNLFPTALLLDGSDLYISLANINGTSQIYKVNAETGSQYFSQTTSLNTSVIYTSFSEGLTAMVLHNNNLYVANTGEYTEVIPLI